MASPMKRKLDTHIRPISPPLLKRRRRNGQSLDLDNGNETQDSALASSEVSIIAPPASSELLTVYSWNVNGIQPLLQRPISFSLPPSNFPLRSFLSRHLFPSLLCLQEVKISPSDTTTQRGITAAANAGRKVEEPTYSCEISLPRDKYNARGLGGTARVHGVATLIRTDLLQQYGVATSKPDWDLEGRVLIHDFITASLVIVNGYWVNGTDNPYRNPENGEVQGTRHDHKLRFHTNMLRLTKSFEAQGKQVVLIGDMNIAPSRIDGHPNLRTRPEQHVKNRLDFNEKFLDVRNDNGMKGVDVFRHLHGARKKFTYHGRNRPWRESCDRVDLVVASRKLVEQGSITGCDICESEEERGHSDHVPLWVSVNLRKLETADEIAKGR